MKTMKVTATVPSLTSKWTVKYVSTAKPGEPDSRGTLRLENTTPTTASTTVSFKYSLPSGTSIKKAQIWATFGSPFTGASIRTVNGISFTQTYNSERGANISLSSASGTYSAVFRFKANGNKTSAGTFSSTQTFSNVYLWIEYEEGTGGGSEDGQQRRGANPKLYAVPPQNVCIYDQTDYAIYMFDGVTKIQHSLSMDIQEEPESSKASKYVNNAKNEPDKVTLDIVMSDVYADGGAIITNTESFDDAQKTAYEWTKSSLIARDTQEPWSRSENAFYTLHWLKEARRKLSVITPQYVHVDMIISSITVNQDDNTPYGWEGQIVLQHAYSSTGTTKSRSATDSGGGLGAPPSAVLQWLPK